MTKLRTGDPWMSSREYSHSLKGVTINLIVAEIERAVVFQREAIGAEVVYQDPDFAVLRAYGSEWMIHADHTYDKHALFDLLGAGIQRGVGAELRVHGCNPDRAEAAARRLGCTVLTPAADKPHGVREAYLLDQDGYLWVPDVPIPKI